MIDSSMTAMQISISFAPARYFTRKKAEGSVIAWGAHVVMPLVVGVAGAIDYVKLPLSAIEELAKGIALIPTIPFSPRLSRRVFQYFNESYNYGIHCIYKLFHGTHSDIKCMYQAFRDPFKMPDTLTPSFYGVHSHALNRSTSTERVRFHPSICDETR